MSQKVNINYYLNEIIELIVKYEHCLPGYF